MAKHKPVDPYKDWAIGVTQTFDRKQVTRRKDGFLARESIDGTRWQGFGRTPRIAVDQLKEKIKGVESGVTSSSKCLFGVLFREWLQDKFDGKIDKGKIELPTFKNYMSIYENHISQLADTPIKDLKEEHFTDLKLEMVKKDVSNNTIFRALDLCKSCLDYIVENKKLLLRNPATEVSIERKRKRPVVVLSEEDIKKFWTIFEQYRYHLAMLLAPAIGPRRGELLGLKWDNVEFLTDKTANLNIVWQWAKCRQEPTLEQRADGQSSCALVLTKGKGDKTSQRVIHINHALTTRLRLHKQWQEQALAEGAKTPEKRKSGKPIIKKDRGFLFAREDGWPPYPDTLNKNLQTYLEKNKIKKINFHELRKTCATIAMGKGNDATTVGNLLGQVDGRMVNSIYNVTNTTRKEKAAMDVQNAISPDTASKTNKVIRKFSAIRNKKAG